MKDLSYVLGFCFDPSFSSVVLIKKERTMHVGMWNGLGGKIEGKEQSFAAMRREYTEEANGHEISEWVKVGFLRAPNALVHIFGAIDPDCVDTHTADDILQWGDHPGCAQILLEGVDVLPLAPYTLGLIYLTMTKLKNPKSVRMFTIGETDFLGS